MILFENGVNLSGAASIQGKEILEKNFQKLSFDEVWNEEKAQSREMRGKKRVELGRSE